MAPYKLLLFIITPPRCMDQTASSMGQNMSNHQWNQPIIWYRYIALFRNKDGSKVSGVKNQCQISNFLTPCKTYGKLRLRSYLRELRGMFPQHSPDGAPKDLCLRGFLSSESSCCCFFAMVAAINESETFCYKQGQTDTVQAPDTRYYRPQLYRYR